MYRDQYPVDPDNHWLRDDPADDKDAVASAVGGAEGGAEGGDVVEGVDNVLGLGGQFDDVSGGSSEAGPVGALGDVGNVGGDDGDLVDVVDVVDEGSDESVLYLDLDTHLANLPPGEE